ncbi:MAG TPA: thiolase family protein [Acidimicrobiia bacterium]|jgi:acetyl-CoA acetyltransferase|nr:thiolase family protein [Acidimicrobiia bacterium]
MDANEIIERRACISGVGQSDIGRRLFRDPLELTLDACLAAIDHAGLTVADIDGLATYPGPMGVPAGFSGAGAYEVIDALRLHPGWYGSGIETSGQLGSVINACMAVAAGLANHVLCFRSVFEGSAQGDKGRSAVMPGGGGGGGGGFKASGYTEWSLPFSAPSAAIWIAMYAQRHFHQYGIGREQLAWIALNARRNAELNPKAIYRDPMTMDDYMSVRMITTPFCLYDCDAPCDGATAAIVSRVDRAKDLRNPPLRVEAVGSRLDMRPLWEQEEDLSQMANRAAGKHLWERTDLTPDDVQMAQIYDGFSWITMSWLESLGFCGEGESGDFIDGGKNIARDGRLPLNTHGGQLSAGRLHGYGFLHEGAVQMWGQGGDRQIATPPEIGVIAAGGGNTCGCLLLVRD